MENVKCSLKVPLWVAQAAIMVNKVDSSNNNLSMEEVKHTELLELLVTHLLVHLTQQRVKLRTQLSQVTLQEGKVILQVLQLMAKVTPALPLKDRLTLEPLNKDSMVVLLLLVKVTELDIHHHQECQEVIPRTVEPSLTTTCSLHQTFLLVPVREDGLVNNIVPNKMCSIFLWEIKVLRDKKCPLYNKILIYLVSFSDVY